VKAHSHGTIPRPRVVVVAESLRPGNGGVARLGRLTARALLAELRERGGNVRAVTLSDRGPAVDLGLSGSGASGSRARFALRVVASSPRATHLVFDFANMARARLPWPLARPFLAWMCGIEVWPGTATARVRAVRAAHTLVAISEFTKRKAQAAFGGFDRAYVCWPGTETDIGPACAPSDAGPPTLLLVGRIDASGDKGHSRLADVWGRVLEAVPDARLRLVGGGPGAEALRDRIAASAWRESIDYLGFVPEDQMEAVFSAATAFAMPSTTEGFGFVFVEAMRAGLPVIASRTDAGGEVNEHGVTGFDVDPDSPREIADAIIALLRYPDRAREMGVQAHRRWRQLFTFSAFDRRFRPILRAFLDGRAEAARVGVTREAGH
jgi:phosphatidylinositol alpha-1,6-mannosyltransferase